MALELHLKKTMTVRYRIFCLVLLCLFIGHNRAFAVLKADFTVSASSGCSPLVVNFTNKSTGASSYKWDFGNGATSTATNPGTIYTSNGTYDVKLIAFDGSGGSDTLSVLSAVTVYKNPNVGFKIIKPNSCTNSTLSFIDTTTIDPLASIVSWKWDFGDGNISTAQNPTHAYTSSGAYTISLSITDNKGCKGSVLRTSFITIYDKPVVNFVGDRLDGCKFPFTVNFTDKSSNEITGSTTWFWDFGDGSTSTSQNPSHTYTSFGAFSVKLKVSITGACTDSLVSTNYINVRKFTYGFKADTTHGCGLFKINFTNLTTPAISSLSYRWLFGDGKTSNNANTSHVYLAKGNYTVKLIVTGLKDGCVDTVTKTNYISIGTPPTSDFYAKEVSSCGTPFKVHFRDTSVNAVSWLWDFGDGTTSTSQYPVHTYTTNDSFTVKLVVKNAQGCTDTLIRPSYIKIKGPKAAIQSPRLFGCKVDNTILFNDATNSIVPVSRWKWYFGDGDTANTASTSHKYLDTGKFDITLVVSTPEGCKDSITFTKAVKIGLKPTANFTATPTDTCIQDLHVKFHNLSTYLTPKSDFYMWNFGDNWTYSSQDSAGPIHWFNDDPLKYTVQLIVFSNGCTDTLIRTQYITVHGPKARWNFFQVPCIPDTVYFNNFTRGGNKFLWDFGDSTFSTQFNPRHVYDSAGTYIVHLHAEDTILGCYSDSFALVTIQDKNKYKPGFTADVTSGCFPITVNFTDTSFNANTWQWDLGNGISSTKQNVSTTYTEPGYYTVKLTITTPDGCQRTVTRSNYIRAYGTIANFSTCKAEDCGAGNVRFVDQSTSPDPMKTRFWNFGDGTTLTTTDTVVNHHYNVPSNQYAGYTVTHAVTDSAGCSSAMTSRIRRNSPNAQIIKIDTVFCGGFFYKYYIQYNFNELIAPFTVKWVLDGGVTINSQIISQVYTTNGTRHLKAIITDFYGCTDTLTDSVVVKIKKPAAGFTVSDTFSACPPLQVQFIDTSVSGNMPISGYLWDFGDGTHSTLQNPKKLYSVAGRFSVKLTVYDKANCTTSVVRSNIIHIKGPIAKFHYSPLKSCDSISVNFKIDSTDAKHLTWDLGDGTLISSSSFKHKYIPNDSYFYAPKLILSDSTGCTYTVPTKDTIFLYPSPVAKILVNDTSLCDTGKVQFIDSTHYPRGIVGKQWTWYFGDGTISHLQNPIHKYATEDTFTVSLKVSDSLGCSDSVVKAKFISIKKQIRLKLATQPKEVCEKEPALFLDSSKIVGTVKYRKWYFGDGDTSLLKNPTHTYASSGTYNVKLVERNAAGCSDTLIVSKTIHKKPKAAISYTNACQGDTVLFTDSSIADEGVLQQHIVSFGDGDTTAATTIRHKYASAGTYRVWIRSWNSLGCSDTISKSITIYPKPSAYFKISAGCLYDNVSVTDSSTGHGDSLISYAWNFGDGNTSTLKNPNHLYSSAGTYTIKLKITSFNGCHDTISHKVTITPKPKSDFSFADTCLLNTSKFTDKSTLSSGTIVSWNWDFGDGSTSTSQSPTHTYATADTFTVRLIVKTASGCKDTIKKNIIIYPLAVSTFTYAVNCFRDSMPFTDLSTISSGSIVAWKWQFGDGDSSSLPNPKHLYRAPGNYYASLMVTSALGCTSGHATHIDVYPKPKAAFTAPAKCFRDTTIFTDTSKVSAGTIDLWSWNFGDGKTSALQNPVHLYTAKGSYSARLIITTNKGCMDTAINTVTVHPKPVADFLKSDKCLADSIQFSNNTSISPGTVNNFSWNFGDGKTSTAQNPWHKYSSAGTDTVTFIAGSDKGCKDTVKKAVTIFPQPVAVFSTSNVCFRDSATFSNTSTVSTGSISSISWNFGDGKTSIATSPQHLYTSYGTYKVTLTIYTDHNCVDTVSHNITVYPKPKADFSLANSCLINAVKFTDKSTVATGTVVAWAWDFGDGNTSTQQNPGYTYSTPNTYTVRLIVTTDKGCKDTLKQSITIYPMPVASFTNNSVCFRDSTPFTDLSGISSGSIKRWSWDFGDGDTSNLKNPRHLYRAPGDYYVGLTVYSVFGCSRGYSTHVIVHPKPKAGFSCTTQCFRDTTSFTDTSKVSTGSIISWKWNFGDGNTSAQQNPKHLYTASGTYTARQIVTSDKGCLDTTTHSIIVHPKPVADFLKTDKCLIDSTQLSNSTSISPGSITSYVWNFGDGKTSTAQNPWHKYAVAGTDTVTLIVSSDKGCKDTVQKTITIFPEPKDIFSTSDVCFRDTALFSNSSTVSTGNIASYSWNFGDATSSVLKSPGHLYKVYGTYKVTLTVYTDHNCSDTVSHNITVYPKPKADFSLANTCLINAVKFTDKSSVATGTVVAWSWDFGDGNTSTQQSPSYTYSAANTYTVRLIITTDKGCKDTLSKSITIYPMPKASFNYNTACFRDSMPFTDLSTISTGSIKRWSWDFGDGDTSNLKSPKHLYRAAGNYYVGLTVYSIFGCSNGYSTHVDVFPKPKAGFSGSNQCFRDTTVFKDTSKVSSGTIITWNWNFGDGNTAAQQHPKHLYTASGTYVVRLIVTSDKGCKDTTTRSIIVYPMPKADFTAANSCLVDSVHYNNNASVSSGTIIANAWDFGDTKTSTLKSPWHTFPSANTYLGTLIVTTDKGCKDTIKKNVVIYPEPKAIFSTSDVCFRDSAIFNTSATVSTGSITTYAWDFGDATNSNSKNPHHLYKVFGTYKVTLKVTTDHSCTDTVSHFITVNPKPKTDFSFSNSCLIDAVKFTDKSSVAKGAVVAWAWDFGDGNTSTSQNPTNKYASANTYNVRLIITTDKGCKDTITKSITIYPMPVASFNYSPACFRDSMPFTDFSSISSGSIKRWSWTFGDGDTSNARNPKHLYRAAGNYNVGLTVYSVFGCSNGYSTKVDVYPKPKAGYTASSECYRNATQFGDTSKVSTGSIVAWSWDFGDSKNSPSQNPVHYYAASGTYTVLQIVTTDKGCKDTAKHTNVIVYPKPKAGFLPKDVCVADSTQFSDQATVSSGTITAWSWDFADTKKSTQSNPWHKYASANTYAVIQVVTTDKGCKDTITKNVVIHPMPKAGFSFSNQCQGQPVTFTDATTVGVGTVQTWVWDFGDGSPASNKQSPVHIYNKSGNFKVKLISGSNFGCNDTLVKTITIYPLPVAAYNFATGCLYDSVSFTDKSTISSGSIKSWYWGYGDGSNTNNRQSPKHKYTKDSTYSVMLVPTSNFGCVDTNKQNVVVHPVPANDWDAPNVCFHDSARFTDKTYLHTGKIVSWNWDFGDAATSTKQNPAHYYNVPKTYTVRLITKTEFGCTDTVKKPITVYPLPQSKWKATTECERDTTRFTDQSTIATGKVAHWAWDFGDTQTDTNRNAKHLYAGPGTYIVRLISFSGFGCSDTSYAKVTVNPRSRPNFGAAPVCFNDTSYFHDSTTLLSGKISYSWDFADGIKTAVQNPKHRYAAPGVYKVRLLTTTDKGCSDTFYRNTVVYHLPVPEFDYTSLCYGDSARFASLSSSLDGKIVKYAWSFGDGKTGKDSAIAHKYAKKGYYMVTLTVMTEHGCIAAIKHRVHIITISADLAVSDTLGCLNKPIQFTDKSVSDTTITHWAWDFGDGSTSNLQNPVYAYTTPGKFNISLTVTDSTGCSSIKTKLRRIEILDNIPPKSPEIYAVSVDDDGHVSIRYKTYTYYDFKEYLLMRNIGGTFTSIMGSSNRHDTTYLEGGLNTLKNVYSYKLLVTDICGNSTYIDSTPVHSTINLTAKPGINKSILTWTPYVGWRVSKYHVYRQDVNKPGTWFKIADVSGDSLHYDDTAIICYQTHQYKILADELLGNQEHSWSDTAATKPTYVPNVLPNEMIRVTVDNNKDVQADWYFSTTRRPWLYMLERSYDNVKYELVKIFDNKENAGMDTTANVHDTSYYYRMRVQDSCGDYSIYTNPMKTILLKINMDSTIEAPVMNWTRYQGWPLGVGYYEVEFYDEYTGTWKTVGSTNPIDSVFTDRLTNAKQSTYCYRIVAYDRENHSIISRSNVACMPTQMHIYVPNVFSPNIDAKNETFNAKGVFVFDYNMKVYNRWGELMYETNDIKAGWDGTYEGKMCQEGVFVYVIKATGSGAQYFYKHGNVTLIR